MLVCSPSGCQYILYRLDFVGFYQTFLENIDSYRNVNNIKKANRNRGERAVMAEQQISPRNSSIEVIDRPNELWQFNVAKTNKGSNHGKKIDGF